MIMSGCCCHVDFLSIRTRLVFVTQIPFKVKMDSIVQDRYGQKVLPHFASYDAKAIKSSAEQWYQTNAGKQIKDDLPANESVIHRRLDRSPSPLELTKSYKSYFGCSCKDTDAGQADRDRELRLQRGLERSIFRSRSTVVSANVAEKQNGREELSSEDRKERCECREILWNKCDVRNCEKISKLSRKDSYLSGLGEEDDVSSKDNITNVFKNNEDYHKKQLYTDPKIARPGYRSAHIPVKCGQKMQLCSCSQQLDDVTETVSCEERMRSAGYHCHRSLHCHDLLSEQSTPELYKDVGHTASQEMVDRIISCAQKFCATPSLLTTVPPSFTSSPALSIHKSCPIRLSPDAVFATSPPLLDYCQFFTDRHQAFSVAPAAMATNLSGSPAFLDSAHAALPLIPLTSRFCGTGGMATPLLMHRPLAAFGAEFKKHPHPLHFWPSFGPALSVSPDGFCASSTLAGASSFHFTSFPSSSALAYSPVVASFRYPFFSPKTLPSTSLDIVVL